MASIEYADGGRGGEAFFVPRSQDPQQCKGKGTGWGLLLHKRRKTLCTQLRTKLPGVGCACRQRSIIQWF